ncbi:LysR family transcriptional regulator [Oceaniglobus roseus]|uniref:LysR family transcriptional regulator n=1 Tax=Oceaniglobus roseus TaxID=1737570 RepID=UPI000C7F2CCB|nr:LysR family transcriptional regulator [Kandeliimicrobium roseum]
MDWSAIPSLAALRAFEAAARNGSYSAAARELNVTHAAIAQHIRTLEDHFGRPLMTREGQGMAVTVEGRELAQTLTQSFGQIATAVRDLAELDRQRPLRVALTPSFAGNWLMPRIGGFWASHPEIPLEIAPNMALVDLRRDGFDLAIRYGRGGWPGVTSEMLVPAGHAVVAAPGLVGPDWSGALSDLQDRHWVLEAGRQEEQVWAAANGLDLGRARVTVFDSNVLVYQAVLAGHGLSILPAVIAERDVAAGRLEILLEEEDSHIAYHILTRPDRVSPQIRTFVKWLKAQV